MSWFFFCIVMEGNLHFDVRVTAQGAMRMRVWTRSGQSLEEVETSISEIQAQRLYRWLCSSGLEYAKPRNPELSPCLTVGHGNGLGQPCTQTFDEENMTPGLLQFAHTIRELVMDWYMEGKKHNLAM